MTFAQLNARGRRTWVLDGRGHRCSGGPPVTLPSWEGRRAVCSCGIVRERRNGRWEVVE